MPGSVSIQLRIIKPKTLRVDKFRLAVLNTLNKEGRETVKEYQKTVATWKNPPKFEPMVSLAGGDATVLVGPTGGRDAVWHYVWTDLGTRAHLIRARRASRLRFRSGFQAKTRPGRIGSGPGKSFGPWVHRRAVWHPGTTPRWFTKTIQARRGPIFQSAMNTTMRTAAMEAFD